jgi:ligand-binding sensor domain-containing protein
VGSTGLYRYNPATNKFDRFENVVCNSPSLIDKNVNAMIEDAQGEFWIGTEAGLYRYHPQQQVCTLYQHDPHDTTSISSDVITSLCEDSAARNTLWIGTNAGLNRYTPQEHLHPLSSRPQRLQSLSHDTFRIREDPKQRGVLWIGTNDGLNQYDPQQGTIVRYPFDARDKIRCDLASAQTSGVLWPAPCILVCGVMKPQPVVLHASRCGPRLLEPGSRPLPL